MQPHTDYGLINWGCANKTTLNSVRKNVKKAVRILSFKKKDCYTETLFENLRILNFDLYNEFTIGKYIWKLSNNYLSMCITTLFKSNEIVIPGHENNFMLPTFSITFNGIKVWKKIPNDIKSNYMFSKFKRKQLSKWLLSFNISKNINN